MKQLYKVLQYVVSKSMHALPVASEKYTKKSILFSPPAPVNCSLDDKKKHTDDSTTCSESPHLRKAENDCKRAQVYWPPTVAMQYQIFCAMVSPGPSKPVLTVSKIIHQVEIKQRWPSNADMKNYQGTSYVPSSARIWSISLLCISVMKV